jgi:hypothetical protein
LAARKRPQVVSSLAVRPDGTVQYAENPPKKYEDIYPFDFETDEWRELWEELKSVVLFWIEQGVRIFRVDNPHRKPFRFWEWLINEIKRLYPEVIFLSEAFTRPEVMYQPAKLGFTHHPCPHFATETQDTYEAGSRLSYVARVVLRRPSLCPCFAPKPWRNSGRVVQNGGLGVDTLHLRCMVK